jgi:hypothetical protein
LGRLDDAWNFWGLRIRQTQLAGACPHDGQQSAVTQVIARPVSATYARSEQHKDGERPVVGKGCRQPFMPVGNTAWRLIQDACSMHVVLSSCGAYMLAAFRFCELKMLLRLCGSGRWLGWVLEGA